MATEAAVAQGTLTNTVNDTVDLTSSGFGTIDAALIFGVNADSSSNPENHLNFSVGFYDGTNQRATGIACEHVTGTSDTERIHSATYALSVPGYTGSETWAASASKVTDGVRLTLTNAGNYGQSTVQALLLKGLTNVEAGHVAVANTVGASVSLSFEPDLVVLLSSHNLTAPTDGASDAKLAIGFSHRNGSSVYKHRGIYMESESGIGAGGSLAVYTSNAGSGGGINSLSLVQEVKADGFDSGGFDISVVSGLPGGRYVHYLAIKLADPDDFEMQDVDSATSTGNDAITSFGFQADAIGLMSIDSAAFNTIYSSNEGGFFVGLGDTNSDFCMGFSDEDGSDPTDTQTHIDASNIANHYFGDGTQNYIASLSSIDSSGFTLNYTDAATSAGKIIAFAFGDSTGGGPDHVLDASDIDSDSQVSAPALTQKHALTVVSLDSDSQVSAPTLTENTADHALDASDIDSDSQVSAPALTQNHALTVVSLDSDSQVSAPAVVDSGSITIAQVYALVNEIHQILGLNASNPMTVTPTSREAGAISQTISGDGVTSTTVTRDP